MRAEDIQDHDFLVGERGYDQFDVRTFLAKVAASYAGLQAEVEALRGEAGPAQSGKLTEDDFEHLGASVANVLRAAKTSAAEIAHDAELRAIEVRAAAERDAADIRQSAEDAASDTRAKAEAAADELRAGAQATIDEAIDHAKRILKDAEGKVHGIQAETGSGLRDRLEAVLAEADGRVAPIGLGDGAIRDSVFAVPNGHLTDPDAANAWS